MGLKILSEPLILECLINNDSPGVPARCHTVLSVCRQYTVYLYNRPMSD